MSAPGQRAAIIINPMSGARGGLAIANSRQYGNGALVVRAPRGESGAAG